MRCVKPFVAGDAAFGCGQCLPCRLRRRRVWSHRLQLEATLHGGQCCFVTLTYEGDVTSLNGKDAQNWVKRLRKRISPRRVRYFLVGEYGDQTERPHYHAALFGFGPCIGSEASRTLRGCGCPTCSVVRETWGLGHILVGRLEAKSASYIAGYVTKKMTHRLDPRLRGREPEFARMSTHPGLGADAMWDVASVLMQYKLESGRDVPAVLAHSKNVNQALGRYLQKKLRKYVGKDERAPEEALWDAKEKLQLVRAFAWNNARSVQSVFEEVNEPYASQIAGRLAIRGRSL